MRYLVDTNIVSDFVRNPQGPVAQRIAEVGSMRSAPASSLRPNCAPARKSASRND